jgi:hypothetical protein
MSCKGVKDTILVDGVNNFFFTLWGKVTTDGTDAFILNDGSGVPVRVVAPGYTVTTGDYAAARGTLDRSTDPVTLNSQASYVRKLK